MFPVNCNVRSVMPVIKTAGIKRAGFLQFSTKQERNVLVHFLELLAKFEAYWKGTGKLGSTLVSCPTSEFTNKERTSFLFSMPKLVVF